MVLKNLFKQANCLTKFFYKKRMVLKNYAKQANGRIKKRMVLKILFKKSNGLIKFDDKRTALPA